MTQSTRCPGRPARRRAVSGVALAERALSHGEGGLIGGMEWHLRLAGPDEWQEVRRLRLEMLAETPIAYGRSLAWAEAQTDDDWRVSQLRAAEDGTLHVVVVDAEDRWLGQAIGKDFGPMGEAQRTAPGIVAVVPPPAVRGSGALGALVEQIATWLRGRGHGQMTLMVHEDNARALRAYEKLGFVLDGQRCPYRPDPTRSELEMSYSLR